MGKLPHAQAGDLQRPLESGEGDFAMSVLRSHHLSNSHSPYTLSFSVPK